MLDGRAEGVQPLKALSVTELTPGVPVVVMLNTPAAPAEKVAWSPLVMAGGAERRCPCRCTGRPRETALVPAGVVTVMLTVPGLMEGGMVVVIWVEL